jgi:hypothetical protein
VALLLVACGALLIWFILAPFLKPTAASSPQELDPRVTCVLCDELRDPDLVIEREFGAGRYHYICGPCLASMVQEYQSQHGTEPGAPLES